MVITLYSTTLVSAQSRGRSHVFEEPTSLLRNIYRDCLQAFLCRGLHHEGLYHEDPVHVGFVHMDFEFPAHRSEICPRDTEARLQLASSVKLRCKAKGVMP